MFCGRRNGFGNFSFRTQCKSGLIFGTLAIIPFDSGFQNTGYIGFRFRGNIASFFHCPFMHFIGIFYIAGKAIVKRIFFQYALGTAYNDFAFFRNISFLNRNIVSFLIHPFIHFGGIIYIAGKTEFSWIIL